ncbi:MAG: MFS transporter [Chloroflexota bacterium]
MKKFKIFYGWWVVSAVFIISAYTSGIVVYGLTALFEPISKQFGWSYTQISLAASIRGLETSLLAPLVGVLIDRWGARKLVFVGAAITGIGLLFLSRTNSLLTLYGAFVLISVGISASGGLILTTIVGHWFRRKLSLAISIAVCGGAFGGILVPLVTRIIDVFEWRTAMVIFGLGAWVIIWPLSLLLRHKPEQYGYLPDGDVNEKSISIEDAIPVKSVGIDIGVRQALKSRAFWHISLGSMCLGLVAAAVVTHVMPYLSSIEISRSISSLVASGVALAGILGRLSFGWLGDRHDKRWITVIGFILSILGLLFFIYVPNVGTWLIVPFFIFFGVGWGGCIPLLPALLVEYYGRLKLGSILGFSMGIILIGNILGPPLAGWMYDNFGSYRGAWFASIVITIIGIAGLASAPPVDYLRRGKL